MYIIDAVALYRIGFRILGNKDEKHNCISTRTLLFHSFSNTNSPEIAPGLLTGSYINQLWKLRPEVTGAT